MQDRLWNDAKRMAHILVGKTANEPEKREPADRPILVEIPKTAGFRSQIEAANLLKKQGAKVVFVSEMSTDELRVFLASRSFSLNFDVLCQNNSEMNPKPESGSFLLRQIRRLRPDYKNGVFSALRVTYHASLNLWTRRQRNLDNVLRPNDTGADLKPESGKALARQIQLRRPEYNYEVFNALRTTYQASLNLWTERFRDVDGSCLLVSEDGIGCAAILIAAAKRNRIPVLCFPYGYGSREDLENDAALKANAGVGYDTASPGGDVVLDHFPKWVNSGRAGGKMLMRPEVILARETLGVSLERPWAIYGSEADVLCAPSSQYRDFVVSEGFDPRRVAVTGSPTGTRIHELVSRSPDVAAAFRKPCKMTAAGTRVLVSIPPSYHADRSHRTAFADYAELVSAIVGPIIQHGGAELSISVHPSIAEEDRKALAPYSSYITDENIFDLMARTDVFITDFSSTTRWAIACGVPTINYDVYQFALGAYDGVEGVLEAVSQVEYTTLLSQLVTDDAFYAATAERLLKVSDDWGRIDGSFADRVNDLIAGFNFGSDRQPESNLSHQSA